MQSAAHELPSASRSDGPTHESSARTQPSQPSISELHENREVDPRIDADMIAFATNLDHRAYIEWGRDNAAVDFERALPSTGRAPSPRMIDRCLWAAWGVISGGDYVSVDFIKRARNRFRAALRDEVAWWRKWDELDNELGDG